MMYIKNDINLDNINYPALTTLLGTIIIFLITLTLLVI